MTVLEAWKRLSNAMNNRYPENILEQYKRDYFKAVEERKQKEASEASEACQVRSKI